MPFIMPVVVVLALILIIIGAIYGVIQARKRREGLFALAQRSAWTISRG